MASFLFTLPFFLLLFLYQPLFSMANLHKSKNLLRSNLFSQLTSTIPSNGNSPTLYFEVTKPIKLPNTKPCSYLVLQHDFGFTYGRPPVLANYTPPVCYSQNFAKIVLEWKATCKGTQFDRIFGVWLGGVELLRSCTAEPTSNGIVWSVEKDITRYYSLLLKKGTQTLAVFLGNILDKTYTGVYHVNLTFHFYPVESNMNDEKQSLNNIASNCHSKADLILPISRNLPLNDGLWFQVQNSNDTKLKQFQIPQNAYRAVLEVYISFHEKDEFWYGNFPNDYIAANNLSDTPGNGPFREAVVSLDGEVVGAVWPFTVVYTGGINPLFWSPITGISSFNLPSYDIEITPFLGNMLHRKFHTFGFSVTNALNVWFIDANLHLWLDSRSAKTEGKLLKVNNKVASVSASDFKGLNGKFLTSANRFISSTGWIKSSYGNITTHSIQEFSYGNSLEIGKDGNFQVVNQIIHFNDRVYTKMPLAYVHAEESFKSFPLNLYLDLSEQRGAFRYVTNVTLGFNVKKYKNVGFEVFFSTLRNMQNAHGVIAVNDSSTVIRWHGTRQVYEYHGSDFCYSRNISSSSSIIDYDEVSNLCDKGEVPLSDLELKSLKRMQHFHAKAFLASDL